MTDKINNLPAVLQNVAPGNITKQSIIALFNTEKVRLNYNKMLQALQNIEISPSTLKTEYPEFKEADKFVKIMSEWRKSEAKPFSDVVSLFLEVEKEAVKPVLDELLRKKEQVRTASAINASEIAKAKKEQERIDAISRTMGEFINKITVDITLSTTDSQIVSIQKRIGSEKARTGFYEEFIDELRTKCDNLSPIINEQKAKIRELSDFNAAYQQALKDNDDTKAALMKEKIESKEFELDENSIRLQEQAFAQSMEISSVQVGQPEVNTVKGKSNRWRWEVKDIELLRKKHPELTLIVPNTEAIELLMKEKRESGEFNGKESVEFNGILFYLKKYL